MGLQEKRGVEEFKTGTFPDFESKIKAAAGDGVDIEVEWDTLASEDGAANYKDFWSNLYFIPLITALEAIASDDMGKTALSEALKKIVIRNTTGSGSPYSWATFEDGVLTLDCDPTTNVDQVAERTESVQTLLEKAL